MSDLSNLVMPATVRSDLGVSSRKGLFQQFGVIAAAQWGLDAREVADRLGAREKLGTTGFGGGFAMPHARFEGLTGIVGIFATLDQPVDFDSVDDTPVDIAFALLSPVSAGVQHLRALSRVSRTMRDREFRDKLRGAGSPDALYALLAGIEARDAA